MSENAIATTAQGTLPTATMGETLGVLADLVVPLLGKGLIIRRPKMVAMAEWLGLDRRAVRRLQKLRTKYGTGPVLVHLLPGWTHALILSPDHVHRVLEGSPQPFATATDEKRATLAHFEPKMALISQGAERAARRRFLDEVLDSDRPMHRLADSFVRVVEEEARELLQAIGPRGELAWDSFIVAWFRIVRRVIFGDGARDDHELTDIMARLRGAANWTALWPKQRKLRERLFTRMKEWTAQAAPGSLASIMAATPTTPDTAPLHQVPQWLFAFDPSGMATFRALALLASHPDYAARARQEISREDGAVSARPLPLLRAAVLESLRLWPTSPLILRQSTEETTWETGVLPAKSRIVIFSPFFHRDDQSVEFANRFAPELWLEEGAAGNWPLIPFSAGSGICPGRNLVLLLTSTMLAELLKTGPIHLQPARRLDASRPLPGTLNNYSLRFKLEGQAR